MHKRVTPARLAGLSRLSGLQELSIFFSRAHNLFFISMLTSLRSLTVSQRFSGLTEGDVDGWTRLSSLETLDLSRCATITDGALDFIARIACLRNLNLSWTQAGSDEGPRHLTALTALTSLHLFNAPPECAEMFSHIEPLKLEHYDFENAEWHMNFDDGEFAGLI